MSLNMNKKHERVTMMLQQRLIRLLGLVCVRSLKQGHIAYAGNAWG